MANITTQTIRVDLSTDKVIPSAFTHQNDTARTLVFDMYNGGLPYTMTGNTVKFAYKSPIVDGAYTVITGSGMASGTVSGNKVTVTLPSEYTAISGVGMLTMIITPTSGTVRPVNIRLVVQKSADGDDTVIGASDFPATLEETIYAWAEENGFSIDDSLTVGGDAAESKTTGKMIESVARAIESISGEAVPTYLHLGTVNTSTGVVNTSTDGTRMITVLVPVDGSIKYSISINNGTSSNISANAVYYDASQAYLSQAGLSSFAANTTTTKDFTVPSNARYVRIRLGGTGMSESNTSIAIRSLTNGGSIVNFGNIVTTGLDLNTGMFINSGMWGIADMQYVPDNYPSTKVGRILSYASNTASSYNTLQIVVDTSGNYYYRNSPENGTWTDWKQVATVDSVDSLKQNTIYVYRNITTTGLDLNTGDFIHPGSWTVNATKYLPANCPTSTRCRIISIASSTDNTIYTYQIVIDVNGRKFTRFSTNTGVWSNWVQEVPLPQHQNIAFKAFCDFVPFNNNYGDLTRHNTTETNRVSKLYSLHDAVTGTGVTVTKQNLGNDATNTFPIYNYKISKNTGSKPVVLIICGEHGDELNSAMVGYYAFREVITGVLKKYLDYVDFWWIPLMNPYGYENGTRNNGNNVNLNRDFPCSWEYSDDEHNTTGNYSLSQTETQYIYNLLVSNRNKIAFLLNKHDTGSIAYKFANNVVGKVAYLASSMMTDFAINSGLARLQDSAIRINDPWVLSDSATDISTAELISSRQTNTAGSLNSFSSAIGIHNSLLEVCGSAYTSNDSVPMYSDRHLIDLVSLGLDFMVNYIAGTIDSIEYVLSNESVSTTLRFYSRKYNETTGEWDDIELYWNGSALIEITD